MIPLLIAMLPVASVAQSQFGVGSGVPSKGVIFLVDAKTEEDARAIMETLPLAKVQLMETEYIPVGPLIPLRALMGPRAQQGL